MITNSPSNKMIIYISSCPLQVIIIEQPHNIKLDDAFSSYYGYQPRYCHYYKYVQRGLLVDITMRLF